MDPPPLMETGAGFVFGSGFTTNLSAAPSNSDGANILPPTVNGSNATGAVGTGSAGTGGAAGVGNGVATAGGVVMSTFTTVFNS
jgi:hypothetical protein